MFTSRCSTELTADPQRHLRHVVGLEGDSFGVTLVRCERGVGVQFVNDAWVELHPRLRSSRRFVTDMEVASELAGEATLEGRWDADEFRLIQFGANDGDGLLFELSAGSDVPSGGCLLSYNKRPRWLFNETVRGDWISQVDLGDWVPDECPTVVDLGVYGAGLLMDGVRVWVSEDSSIPGVPIVNIAAPERQPVGFALDRCDPQWMLPNPDRAAELCQFTHNSMAWWTNKFAGERARWCPTN